MQYSYIEKWKEITNSWSHCSSQELRTLSSQYESSRDSLYKYERSLQLFLEKLMDNIDSCNLHDFLNTYRDIPVILSNCSRISSFLDQVSIKNIVQLLFKYHSTITRFLCESNDQSLESEFLLRGQEWCLSQLDHFLSLMECHESTYHDCSLCLIRMIRLQ